MCQDFQHIEDNKDQGHNIRTKAAQMVAFLKDDEKLKNERAKAQMARKRFAQNNIGIMSFCVQYLYHIQTKTVVE